MLSSLPLTVSSKTFWTAFSEDSSFLLLADGQSVSVCDLNTKETRRFDLKAVFVRHEKTKDREELKGILNSGQGFSFNMLTDKLKIFGEEEGPVEKVISCSPGEDGVCFLGTDANDLPRVIVLEHDLKIQVASFKVKEFGSTPIAVALLKNQLVALANSKSVVLRNYGKKGAPIEKEITIQGGITCMNFDQSSERLSIGDKLGRIHTVTNIFQPNHLVQISHWHSSSVGTIGFLPGGQTMVSGGQEGVLVFWKNENTRKDFCPRLDGPIVSATTDDSGEYICVGFQNGSIRVVRAANYESVFNLTKLHSKDVSKCSFVDGQGCTLMLDQNSTPSMLRSSRGHIEITSLESLAQRNTINHTSSVNQLSIPQVSSF